MKHAKAARAGLILAISVFVAGTDPARAVEPGDPRSEVVKELGEPAGVMKMGRTQILTYARGTVELMDDVVVKVNLVSAEDAEARRLQREAEERQRQELARERREQRTAEGLEVYARKISDPAFMNAPAAERVSFWKSFQKTYPDVELGEEYAQAQREYALENAAKSAAAAAEEERIRQQAEARAAEINAASQPHYTYGYPGAYVNRPVIVRPTTERPGTRPQPIVVRPGGATRPARPVAR